METITLNSHVGSDGLLKLEVPVKTKDADLEVVLIVQPLRSPVASGGWSAGFFEEVAGGWQGERLIRDEQGEYEIREDLE